MRWYVINLAKHKTFISLSVVSIILVLTLSLSLSAISGIYSGGLFISAAADINNSKIIIIDPGHGGEDSGAVSESGVLEKDLALSVAFEVGKELEKRGYAVVYTRTEDKLLYTSDEDIKGIRKISDLKNRCAVANSYPDSVFVSIHMNSFAEKKYSGLQVYYSENNDISRSVADSVQNKVRTEIQPDNNRTVKKGKGIYVLENISNPAILVECGFLTNVEECKKLSEKDYQKMLSFSIVCGIIEVLE